MEFLPMEKEIWPAGPERNRNRQIRRVMSACFLLLILGAAALTAGCTRGQRPEGAPAAPPAVTTPARPAPPTVTPAVPGALSPGVSLGSHREASEGPR